MNKNTEILNCFFSNIKGYYELEELHSMYKQFCKDSVIRCCSLTNFKQILTDYEEDTSNIKIIWENAIKIKYIHVF